MLSLKTIEASENLFSDEHAKLCHGANCSFDHNLREDITLILFSIFNISKNSLPPCHHPGLRPSARVQVQEGRIGLEVVALQGAAAPHSPGHLLA